MPAAGPEDYYGFTLNPIEDGRYEVADLLPSGLAEQAGLELFDQVTDVDVEQVAGHWTPLAARQALWVVTHLTPGEGEGLFRELGNMRPSKSSLDRLPKRLGESWEAQREAFEADLRAQLEVPDEAVTVSVSLDGVMAPMKDGERQAVMGSRRSSSSTRSGWRCSGSSSSRS